MEIDVAGLAVNPLNILHGAFHAALAVEVAQTTYGGKLSDLMTRSSRQFAMGRPWLPPS